MNRRGATVASKSPKDKGPQRLCRLTCGKASPFRGAWAVGKLYLSSLCHSERSEESRSARLAITRLLAFFRQDARLVLTGKGGK